MESLNRMAVELVDEAIDFADELGIAVRHLDNDAVVLDFGVEAAGGIEAGLLLAEIATGGLATVQTSMGEVGGRPRPYVELSTDRPTLALLCSAAAGWPLDSIGGVGSGPARLYRREGPGFDAVDHEDDFDFAVLAVESGTLPDGDVAREVAEVAGVPTGSVFLPTAPAASLAGSVATAARAAEVAAFRYQYLGNDPADLVAATGSAPLPPVTDDEATAIARANDAIAYGGRTHLAVEGTVARAGELAFGATDHAGASFADLLDETRDFAAVEDAFAPAAVTVDVRGGPTHAAGEVDDRTLADRWG